MKTLYRIMDTTRNVFVCLLLSFVIIIGAVQIFLRYTPGINPLRWVDEIMRYMNIWIVMLAASIGVKFNNHLKMDYFLYKLVPERLLPTVKIISHIIIVTSLCILVYFGTLRTVSNIHTIIQSAPISIAFFYAAIPIGSLLILIEYILFSITEWNKEEKGRSNHPCSGGDE